MAVTAPTIPLRHFARLKLRIVANGMRGSTSRGLLFAAGLLATAYFGFVGFMLFATPGLVRSDVGAEVAAGLAGSALMTGWVVVPLVLTGVDESVDPARFALLPVTRRTLVGGLLTAAVIGLPPLTLLIATSGLVVSALSLGGWAAGLAALVGVVLGLLVAVAASRAVTSAFAAALRSRKVRDLAAVLLAAVAALFGPVQLALMNRIGSIDVAGLRGTARVLGWTPLGAPFTLGMDVAAGRAWAVPVKLVIIVGSLALLLVWWSRSLDGAMLGVRGARAAMSKAEAGDPINQLYPCVLRWLPKNRFGALVSRELRYWWREPRRRAGLISFGVIGSFLPAFLSSDSESVGPASTAMIFAGVFAALNLANQFGFEGTAYAANLVAGVPGRAELHSRAAGLTVYVGPVLIAGLVGAVVVGGHPGRLPQLAGTALAAYGVGLALASTASVVAAYAMPDTSNPFAMSTGGGAAKSLLSIVVLVAGGVGVLPYVVLGWTSGAVWTWLALPVGALYGGAAYVLGLRLAALALDTRAPELLLAVDSRR